MITYSNCILYTIVSVNELQRCYRKVLERTKQTNGPILVLKHMNQRLY
jgi:hypothetical protein